MAFKVTAPVRIDISAGWPDSDPYRKDFGGVVLNGAINLRAHIEVGNDFTSSYGEAWGLNGLGASGAIDAAYLVARNRSLEVDKLSLIDNVHGFENGHIRQRAGLQDQAAAIYGGVNLWEFLSNGAIRRTPVPVGRAKHFEDRVVLVHTGADHLSANIHDLVFGPGNYEKNIPRLDRMKVLAREMYNEIDNEEAMGRLMSETWELQRGLHTSIETDTMRRLQKVAHGHYLACRATGAGGGGCMIFYTNARDTLVQILGAEEGIKIVPFKFDYEGLKVEEKDAS